MTEEELIASIKQAKIDCLAATNQSETDAANAASLDCKQKLYALRNPKPTPPVMSDEQKAINATKAGLAAKLADDTITFDEVKEYLRLGMNGI